MSSFRTVKKRRACPAGSPPAEIWTMLLHASRNLSPGGQGIGYQRKKIELVFTMSLVEKLLCRVRLSGTAPLAWHHGSGAPLHKSNKAGPKGKIVVHVLPSVDKQFFKVLLRTKRDMWSPPAPADWLQGYIPGRRRESAVLIRQVTTWRLERPEGLSLPYQCIWVGQVGGDGSSCTETIGSELPSWAAETQAGDHNDPGQGWGYHAQNWGRRIVGRPSDGGSVLGDISPVDVSLAACCGRRGGGVRTTACMASLVGWKDRPFTIAVCRRHNQTDCC